MMTYSTVWVLVAFLYAGTAGGPMVIDDIATEQECKNLIHKLEKIRPNSAECFPVKKLILK